jgi:hypothetical protein
MCLIDDLECLELPWVGGERAVGIREELESILEWGPINGA